MSTPSIICCFFPLTDPIQQVCLSDFGPDRNVITSTPAPACSESLTNDTKLHRVLRLPDLVLLIIGTVTGSGIVLVPGLVVRAGGRSLLVALSVWLVGGILPLLGALTYGELSAMNPAVGGLRVSIRA